MARTAAHPGLAAAFARGRDEGRALVMPFLVCGYPTEDAFIDVAAAAAEAGADVLEVGIPFSDPIMDGPVIQAATVEVLDRGLPVARALDLCGLAYERAGIPIVAMTYYNVPFRAGLEAFARRCAEAGIAGVIVPDLSVEESGEWCAACRAAGVAPVFLVAPTSTPDRIRRICDAGDGFVYAASTLGVTGVREDLSRRARELVAAVRSCTDMPVAVGIGVSTPEHAREVAGYADGVIVGTALVAKIRDAADPAAATREFVGALRSAVGAS